METFLRPPSWTFASEVTCRSVLLVDPSDSLLFCTDLEWEEFIPKDDEKDAALSSNPTKLLPLLLVVTLSLFYISCVSFKDHSEQTARSRSRRNNHRLVDKTTRHSEWNRWLEPPDYYPPLDQTLQSVFRLFH